MSNSKQQSIEMMQSLKPIQNRIDPVMEMWMNCTSEEDFLNKLKESNYSFILNTESDKQTPPNSLVFTPEDDPADRCYYTSDGNALQSVFMEKITMNVLEEEDLEDNMFWNVKTLRMYSNDFTEGIFSITLK
jgi:hypothetical protein